MTSAKKNNDLMEIVKDCASELDNKKATDIKLLDLTKMNSYFDFFLIASGNSHIHGKSLAKNIEKFLYERGLKIYNKPDLQSGWIILDCGMLIIHIFTEETRNFYQLEKLWADAGKVEFQQS